MIYLFKKKKRVYIYIYLFSLVFLLITVRTRFVTVPDPWLGSDVKGPNNKFVERGCQRTRLISKEKRSNSTFTDGSP